MKTWTLLKTSLMAIVVLALCCVTPLLVWLLALVGLSAWVAYLDMALLPALAFFIALMLYAFVREDKV